MIQIVGDTVAVVWQRLADELMFNGAPSAPRGLKIRELLGVSIQLNDPLANVLYHPDRRLNYRFMVAEWLWIYFGHDDVQTIARYNPRIAQFSDNGVNFNGSYGVPVKAQWPGLVELLRRDPDSRQAVLVIFKPQSGPTKDVPCTISLQFLLRIDGLHTIATMRSSDLVLGLPHDIFNFTMLANCLATELGCPPLASFTLNIGSSHVYEPNWPMVRQLLDSSQKFETFRSPRLKTPPPSWLDHALKDPVWIAGISDRVLWHRYNQLLAWETGVDPKKPSQQLKEIGTESWDE